LVIAGGRGVSKVRRWAAGAACLLWIGWAVWDQFLTLPPDEVANHSSGLVQDRMLDCSGTFRQRYECKNAIIIENDRSNFFAMAGRIAIVVVPPLLLLGGLRLAGRGRADDGPAEEYTQARPQRRYHRRRTSH
jgi:hypothetical protein